MAGKKTAVKVIDPKLAELEQMRIETVEDCDAASKEAAAYNAKVNSHRAEGSKFAAYLKVLVDKITAFATSKRKSLPIENDRWRLAGGVVTFGSGSELTFAGDVTMETIVKRLRKLAPELKAAGVTVSKLIKREESVKYDDLRSIPKKFHKKLGYAVGETSPVGFAFSDAKTSKTKGGKR